MKKKINALIIDRANYGRLLPVLQGLQAAPDIELKILCSGTMVLPRFGHAEAILEKDGLKIDNRLYIELEGSNPVTMAKSLGIAVSEFASEFNRSCPDFLVLIGDRYEALAATIAAAYMGITIIHLQGGEVSGSIDESARHAISKFAHYHFAATERARNYLLRMGEDPKRTFNFGCPVADVILRQNDWALPADIFQMGVGAVIDPTQPYFLVIFHPITTRYGEEKEEVIQLLAALEEMAHPTVWLWPNIDAGSDNISRLLREYREKNEAPWLRLIKNFPPEMYQRVLKNAALAIGNSSSFVRDSSFTGTPVVLVGDRQFGRESGPNVHNVRPKKRELMAAISRQLAHGPYAPQKLYGQKGAAQRIVEKIRELTPVKEKYLHYIYDEDLEAHPGEINAPLHPNH